MTTILDTIAMTLMFGVCRSPRICPGATIGTAATKGTPKEDVLAVVGDLAVVVAAGNKLMSECTVISSYFRQWSMMAGVVNVGRRKTALLQRRQKSSI